MKRDKFKSYLSLIKKGLLVLFVTDFAFTGVLKAQTPFIWPVEISFNYDENSTTYDAVTIKKNADNSIIAPEYLEGSKYESCAYIIGQSNRKIKVKFDSNNSTMNYLVKSTVISGNGPGNVCEIFVASCDLDSKVFTIDLQGTVPGYVGKHEFTWEWEATALPTVSPFCPITCAPAITEHTYYTLLASPKPPMDVPWTDVLDYACVWADGEQSESGSAQKITEGIYSIEDLNGDIDYDWPYGACMYSTGPYNRYFALKSFLSDIASSTSVKVNCSDAGNLFSIFASVIGLAAYNKVIWRSTSPYYFDVNKIDPIGSPGWKTTQWGYHQFGWYNNYVDDACLRVNNNNPIIPSNMNQSTYDNYLIGYYNYDQSQIGTTSVY
jgi:hypothetical protein